MAARSRTTLLLIALASGLLAAFLAVRYLRRQATPILTGRSVSSGTALVAARDLPVGTTLTERDLRLVDWPGDAIPQGLLSDPKAAIGRGTLQQVRLNEPILDTKLAPVGAGGGMPTLITQGLRAMSLRVDEVSDISGFVFPGTRVDVLLTMEDPASEKQEPTTRSILQNIPTLAAGQAMQKDPEGRAMPVSVVTVMVTPAQAETLALASNQGKIQLALRHQLDTLEARTPGARRTTLLYAEKTPLGSPIVRRPTTRSAPSRPVEQQETIVEGFEGGNRTVRRFSTTP